MKTLKTALLHPNHVIGKINCSINHFFSSNNHNPDGIDIFEETWDNLLILDACRYDMFCSHSNLPGKTEARISQGSTTKEFIRANFANRTRYDVVYVSANGWFATLRDEIQTDVHEFILVERDAVDGLTSRAQTVAETALRTAEQYPNKRLIVHFMQPHQPFIGPLGEKFNHDGYLPRTIRKSNVTRKEVIEAYEENLELVLEQAAHLIDRLRGKTVITADHGELLGERMRPIPAKIYGHPEGVYVPELVTVPWHVYESGTKKEIIAEEPPEEIPSVSETEVKNHLSDLGYIT